MELLTEDLPGRNRLAVLYDEDSADQFAVAERQARSLRLDVRSLKLENPPYDFDAAFQSLANGSPQMLLVLSSYYFTPSRSHIAKLAIQQWLPTMFIFKSYVEAGGLISYGVDPSAIFRQVGFYVAKILNGAKPADLPIQQPVKFELVINLKTAKAIGVDLSTAIQLRADDVIKIASSRLLQCKSTTAARTVVGQTATWQQVRATSALPPQSRHALTRLAHHFTLHNSSLQVASKQHFTRSLRRRVAGTPLGSLGRAPWRSSG